MKKYYDKDKLEVGIDEVARGCLAGPVFSAGVIGPKELDDDLILIENQIKDSKKLSRKKRNELRYFRIFRLQQKRKKYMNGCEK